MFSQANNNPSCLLGQPDPQTGTFSFAQKFGKLQANSGFGPSYDFQMNFSLLSTLNSKNTTGVGRGFSFKLGGFSQTAQTVTLNSGASYKVFAGAGKWALSHKLKDIFIEGNSSGDEAYIYHNSGDMEVLKSDLGSNTDMYLSRYVASNGRYLEFHYSYHNGYYRLSEVVDSDSVALAKIEYEDDYKTTVTVYPSSTKEKKVYTLNFDAEGLLYLIETPIPSEVIKIEYKNHTDPQTGRVMYTIEKISYPTGATEEAQYFNSMILPLNAPVHEMPALSTHTKTIASNQPAIITNYSYEDDYNYWGLNSGVNWVDYKDGLFDCSFAYRYKSTVTCGTKKSVTIYNKFHQTVETRESNGNENDVKITTVEYYCDEEKVLDEQETRYEQEKSKSMEIQDSTGGSRILKQVLEYDDWGNLLSQTEPNGTSTVSVYYPAEGGDGCPANPYGLVAFKKSETLKSNDSSAEKVKTFTYKVIPAVDGNTTRCVVSDCKSYEGNTFVTTTFDSSNPKLQCVTSGVIITTGGKTSNKTFDFEFGDESYTVRETLTGFDGTTTSTSKTLSQFSALMLEDVDSTGVITKYTYDLSERVTSTIEKASTDYQVTTTYSYTLQPNGEIGTLVSHKPSIGFAEDVYYDADQKELFVHREDDSGTMRKMSETSYDDQGREVTETRYDHVIASDNSIQETYTNTVTKAYDSWGQVNKENRNGGAMGTEYTTFDPVNLTKKVQFFSGSTAVAGATVTRFNLFGKAEQIDTLTVSGEVFSTTKHTFNGFGLSASTTTPMSATASILEYDSYDRPLKVQHFDGSVVIMEYPAFTTKQLTSSMKLASSGYVIGQHEYDGLLRVTSRTVNDVKRKFTYEASYSKPSRIVNGLGQTILFNYIPELGLEASKKACFTSEVDIGDWENPSKESEADYKFGKSSDSNAFLGRIVSALSENGQYKHDIEYTSKGYVKSATQTVESLSKKYVVTKTTMNGKPLKFSFDGREMSISYDQYGRVVGSTDGEISAETVYDGADRVIKEVVKKNGSPVRTTDVTFDEHSREAQRTIVSGGKTIAIKQEYDLEDKVTKRVTTVDSSDVLTEEFSYDVKRRLATYTATTSVTNMLPCNEQGKPFNSQSFEYDELNNKKKIVTKFPNGDSDTASFTYDTAKHFQLNKISHSLTSGDNAYPPEVSLTYDADGNILKMGDSSMTYSVSGRLSSRNGVSFSYDPFDRLVKSGQTSRFYSGPKVMQEVTGTSITRFVRHGNNTIAQVADGMTKIFGFNHQSSIVCVADGSSLTTTTYSPFGTARDNGVRVGFNGELKDISDPNMYPLGNGTRSYFSSVGRFSSSDTYSPFNSTGEINPYAYCDADPVNASDPTGHGLISGIKDNMGYLSGAFSIVMGLVGLFGAIFTGGASLVIAAGVVAGLATITSGALGIAAEAMADQGKTEQANRLANASFGVGLVGTILSLGASSANIAKVVKTRSAFKGGKFAGFLESDDAIGYQTKHSFNFSKLRPKSKSWDVPHTLKRVKVRPDGIFRGGTVPRVKYRAGGFLKTTQKPITKSKLFTETGELRSLPSVLKKNRLRMTVAGSSVSAPVLVYTIATFDPNQFDPEDANSSQLEQTQVSSVGLPTNPHSYANDDSGDEEED